MVLWKELWLWSVAWWVAFLELPRTAWLCKAFLDDAADAAADVGVSADVAH